MVHPLRSIKYLSIFGMCCCFMRKVYQCVCFLVIIDGCAFRLFSFCTDWTFGLDNEWTGHNVCWAVLVFCFLLWVHWALAVLLSTQELDIIYKIPHCVPISAHHKWNFDDLLEKMWSYLRLVRMWVITLTNWSHLLCSQDRSLLSHTPVALVITLPRWSHIPCSQD